jgi:hypothetical protein
LYEQEYLIRVFATDLPLQVESYKNFTIMKAKNFGLNANLPDMHRLCR